MKRHEKYEAVNNNEMKMIEQVKIFWIIIWLKTWLYESVCGNDEMYLKKFFGKWNTINQGN